MINKLQIYFDSQHDRIKISVLFKITSVIKMYYWTSPFDINHKNTLCSPQFSQPIKIQSQKFEFRSINVNLTSCNHSNKLFKNKHKMIYRLPTKFPISKILTYILPIKTNIFKDTIKTLACYSESYYKKKFKKNSGWRLYDVFVHVNISPNLKSR